MFINHNEITLNNIPYMNDRYNAPGAQLGHKHIFLLSIPNKSK